MEENFSPAKAARGERKLKILKEAEFKKDSETLDWIKITPTWADDIKYYEDSIEKPKEKEKKTSKGA